MIASPAMSARCTAPLLIFLALLSAPALAADPPSPITARLEYAAARGCPPASVLGAEFARRMGYDPFVESAPLRVVATIVREKNALAFPSFSSSSRHHATARASQACLSARRRPRRGLHVLDRPEGQRGLCSVGRR